LSIDKVLKGSNRISDVRWFPSFETPDYLSLMRPSNGPLREPQLDSDLSFALKFERANVLFVNFGLPGIAIFGIVVAVLFKNVFPESVNWIWGAIGTLFLVSVFILPCVVGRLILHEAQRVRQRITGPEVTIARGVGDRRD
jgi:hypothetical protein